VHTPNSFDYAVIRVVPFTEREEFFNAGVILFCPQQKFLEARVRLDCGKLRALAPALQVEEVQQRLDAVVRICAGDKTAGPIARISQRARFHWLVAPRSTLIQVSPVHSGICDKAEPMLDRLFQEQVLDFTERPHLEPKKEGGPDQL
jgi:Protein of unknown function (DUF3037)